MKIDPAAGSITFTGRKTEWMGKSPEALGFTGGGDATPGKEIVPQIRERQIDTNTQK